MKKQQTNKNNKKTWLISVIVLVLIISLSFQAVATNQRRMGIQPIIIMPPITHQKNLNITNSSLIIENISLDKIELNETTQTPLKGNIIISNETNGYYVLLGDSEPTNDLILDFSELTTEKIEIDKPIFVKQKLRITNEKNKTLEETINLWDFSDYIPENNLRDINNIEILLGAEVISEKPMLEVKIEPNETKEYTIIYQYSPITKTLDCINQTIVDVLPEGAIIQHTDLPLDTVISTKCELEIKYTGLLDFKNLSVPLTELSNKIKSNELISIINEKTGDILKIENNKLII